MQPCKLNSTHIQICGGGSQLERYHACRSTAQLSRHALWDALQLRGRALYDLRHCARQVENFCTAAWRLPPAAALPTRLMNARSAPNTPQSLSQNTVKLSTSPGSTRPFVSSMLAFAGCRLPITQVCPCAHMRWGRCGLGAADVVSHATVMRHSWRVSMGAISVDPSLVQLSGLHRDRGKTSCALVLTVMHPC